jgi:methylenetetrahydrofolate--tRNA-(uracil-5-)-methyltransferase
MNVQVVGGGLAGSEAAWQIAKRGISVTLYEMRPNVTTGAHQSRDLAELVCSNSLGSQLPDRASGILMSELDKMGSLLLEVARQTEVPAGGALAVGREAFARLVTEKIESHPLINVERQEVKRIPDGVVILATGPLTAPALSQEISDLAEYDHLYFFDALSPIVDAESIDMSIAFRDSRYGRGKQEQGDYINCPFTQEEYDVFVKALLGADRIELRPFEVAITDGVRAGAHRYFEGCLPVEIIAERGFDALAFGPMRPVGLTDPRTGRRPHAVVQLRQDNLVGSLYNLVGFQTNLTFKEQRNVFRLIPGLGKAVFVRYGQMHRNTFINAPKLLAPTLQWKSRESLFLAGQITGVEGYLGNIATGLLAGVNAVRYVEGKAPYVLPPTTMLGALCRYITQADPDEFQPMKANLGILPPFTDNVRRNRRQRAQAHADRSRESLEEYLQNVSHKDK